ncbi:MAG TPA: ClbS/DfsB family four-helix bundle protein [Dehalococcoidales bacterium]
MESAEISAILNALPTGTVHGSGATAWNSRDVYAHMARWLSHSSEYMELAGTGKKPPFIEESQVDEINHRWQKEDSKLTLAEARTRAQEEFKRRVKIIKSMPPELWTEEMVKVVYLDGANHYHDHRKYITG